MGEQLRKIICHQDCRLCTSIQRAFAEKGIWSQYWQLIDFKWMQGNPRGPHRFLSTKTHKQFDCADKRVRLLAFTEFSRGMGTGMPRDGHVDKDHWLLIEAESMSYALWEAVCDKE